MRKLILALTYTAILLVLISYDLFGQTVRYVDNRIGTSGNGQSWATAWKNFSNITWSELSGGGYLYIAGNDAGDSLIYNESVTVGSSGGWENYIYIIAGKYAPSAPDSVKGKVVILRNSDNGITINGRSWLYIKGLTVQGAWLGILGSGNTDYIVIDSCDVIDHRNQGIAGIANDTQCTDSTNTANDWEIKNCRVISAASGNYVTDCIYWEGMEDFKFHHNFVHQQTIQPTSQNHIDCIQFARGNANIKIYNNVFIVDSMVRGHNLILTTHSRTSMGWDTTLIYNNYFYNGGYTSDISEMFTSDNLYLHEYGEGGIAHDYAPTTLVINNTFVNSNAGIHNTRGYYPDTTMYYSNNIMVQTGENFAEPDVPSQYKLDNFVGGVFRADSQKTNLIWTAWGTTDRLLGSTFIDGDGSPAGNPSSWADWITNYHGTGVNEYPAFTNNFRIYTDSNLPYTINDTSAAIDAGTDMSYILNEFSYLPDFEPDADIEGNPRGATWDIGAFEYPEGWSAPDTVPSFSFTAITNAELDSEYVAKGALTALDSTCNVWTTTSASFKINYNGTYSTAMKTADPDNGADTVYVKNLSSGLNSTLTTETIVAGGNSQDFDVTTKAATSSTKPHARGSDGKFWIDSTGKRIKLQ